MKELQIVFQNVRVKMKPSGSQSEAQDLCPSEGKQNRGRSFILRQKVQSIMKAPEAEGHEV